MKQRVDQAAFSFGRLSLQLHIAAPRGAAQRLAILERLSVHKFKLNVASEVIEFAAQRSHGLSPAELEAVLRESFLWAQEHEEPINERAVIEALRLVEPNLLKQRNGRSGIALSNDNREWQNEEVFGDVIGMTQAKRGLCLNVLLPLQEQQKLMEYGLIPPKGVLLHGPTGNGKTFLTAAFSRGLENLGLANFIFIHCTDLVSKVVGESEKNISKVFAQARKVAPCILFFDQIEMLAPKRGMQSSSEHSFDRLLSCLLVELDGISAKLATRDHVVIVATTQDRDALDPAILRPGRFDKHIHIGNPDAEDCVLLVRHLMSQIPVAVQPDETREEFERNLAQRLKGKSRAEIAGVFKEAAMLALRESNDAIDVEWRHFDSVLDNSYTSMSGRPQ